MCWLLHSQDEWKRGKPSHIAFVWNAWNPTFFGQAEGERQHP
jgi:hypothetical protein